MDRIINYIKINPSSIDCIKLVLLEYIEYPAVAVLFEAIRDLEDEIKK